MLVPVFSAVLWSFVETALRIETPGANTSTQAPLQSGDSKVDGIAAAGRTEYSLQNAVTACQHCCTFQTKTADSTRRSKTSYCAPELKLDGICAHQLEWAQRAMFWSMAATVSAEGVLAGEARQASLPLFPAPTPVEKVVNWHCLVG
jgi:hypothetical protein